MRGSDGEVFIASNCFQSTGHQILMAMLVKLNSLRHERGIPATPYLVDLHDSTTWQTPESRVDDTVQLFRDSVAWVNEQLNWTVEIKMEPKVGISLADFLED